MNPYLQLGKMTVGELKSLASLNFWEAAEALKMAVKKFECEDDVCWAEDVRKVICLVGKIDDMAIEIIDSFEHHHEGESIIPSNDGAARYLDMAEGIQTLCDRIHELNCGNRANHRCAGCPYFKPDEDSDEDSDEGYIEGKCLISYFPDNWELEKAREQLELKKVREKLEESK